MPRAINGRKQCSRCGKTKSVAAFHRDHTRLDGRYPQCILCSNASRRIIRQRPKPTKPRPSPRRVPVQDRPHADLPCPMVYPRYCWYSWQATLRRPLSGYFMRGAWDAVEGYREPRSMRDDQANFREAYHAGRAAGREYLRVRPWLRPEPVGSMSLLDRLRA